MEGAFSADELKGVVLRRVAEEDRHDRSAARVTTGDVAATAAAAEDAAEEAKRREYFFSTGVDEWYDESLESATFRSVAVELTPEEARAIVSFWTSHVYGQETQATAALPTSGAGESPEEDAGTAGGFDGAKGGIVIGGAAVSPVEFLGIPDALAALVSRIDAAIRDNYGATGAFVKLSTRSPKDAKLALRQAAAEYARRLEAGDSPDGLPPPDAAAAAGGSAAKLNPTDAVEANRRIALLAEVQSATLRVASGEEAVRLMLDSERVAEDLKFGLEAVDAAGDDSKWNVSVSVREWCPEVKLHSEWRGFVWGGTLNALGQYYHPLYFPCLAEDGMAERVGEDCARFFNETVKPVLTRAGLSNCMVDFAWLGEGRVLLVEINPFDGVLGAFPVSTGLFLWDDPEDQRIMREGPLQVRVRREVLSIPETKDKMNPDWRRIVFDG